MSSANRLLGALPGIINYWYRFSHDGVRIDTDTDADSLAGHFLETLTGKKPSALHASDGRFPHSYAARVQRLDVHRQSVCFNVV